MMKGIWFDNIHSYDDLNLVLSKVEIPPAAAKINMIDIPGGDGSADLTEALGEVRYKNRDCKFTFTVFPRDDFEEKKREVSNLLNGKKCYIIVDKDPDYHWVGRCTVNEYASDKNIHKIVVGASVAPYKLKNDVTRVIVPGGVNVARTLENSRKTTVPTITCTAEATVVFGDNTFRINAGTHTFVDIMLVQGTNPVTVTSEKDVLFTYQEGDL